MARKIVLKQDGLASTGNAPDGYKYLGFDGDTASEKTGATVSSIGGGSDYLYTEISVSSAQILSMGSSPVTLLSAPGANTYYDWYGYVEYTHNTTDYTISGDMIMVGGENSYGGALINIAMISQTSNKIAKVQHRSSEETTSTTVEYPNAWPMELNEGIILAMLNGTDPTGGDGTMLIKLWYKIKTFGTEL